MVIISQCIQISNHVHTILYVNYTSIKKKYVLHEKKLNIELPFDPTIPLLVIYLNELKAGTQTGTYTPMLIAAVFTNKRKEPKCPSISEWDKKNVMYTCNGILFTLKNE